MLCINIAFRLIPAFLPFTKDMARGVVMNNLTNEAKKQIDEKFKGLPFKAKAKATQDLVNIWKQKNKKAINESIRDKQKEIRSYWQDDQGQTFLFELDCYHWFRLVKNLLSKGKLWDKVINSVKYDSFMLAPVGKEVSPSLHQNLHVYLSYYLFRAVSVCNKNINLMHFLFYLPILISSLGLITTFFLSFSISHNKSSTVAFFAAMTLGLINIFLYRSGAGWFDTDPYVVLFSLLSVWTFYLSLKDNRLARVRVFFAVLSGLSIGLFSFSWDGWWYIFDLMVFSALYYILNLYFIKKSAAEGINLNIPLISLLTFLVSAIFFVILFSGWQVFKHFVSGPINIIFAKGYLQKQFWPNAFLTVQELRGVYFREFLYNIGGAFVLISGLIYLLIMLFDKQSKDYKQRQFILILFSFWIVILAYVSMKAIRFSLLLMVPLSISFGLFLERLLYFISKIISRWVKIRKVKEIVFTVGCIIYTLILINNAFRLYDFRPLFNRGWWDVLNKLRTQTQESAIINSWWDYGHWFKAIAERRVIFDGATQNTPMSYWMGRVFLADNETEAMGILRMINSGSNKAFEELEKLGIPKLKCLDILNEIILLKQKEAEIALGKYISKKEDRERIIKYTHNPQQAYFIVESRLIGIIGAISFLGGWDFKKANIYQKFTEFKQKEDFISYLIKEYQYNRDEASSIYGTLLFLSTEEAKFWISPKSFYYRESSNVRQEGNLLFFDPGFVVDLVTHSVYFDDANKGKWSIPKSIFYFEDNVLKEVDFKDSNVDFSVLLFQDKGNYKLLVLDGKLARSMLTKLYYLNGRGLKYFKSFARQELKNNEGYIIVYKIDWDV